MSNYTPVTGPAPIIIPLTPEQAQQLQAHFTFVRSESERGFRGMLVAQVWEQLVDVGNQPALRVGFLPYDKSKVLERSIRIGPAE